MKKFFYVLATLTLFIGTSHHAQAGSHPGAIDALFGTNNTGQFNCMYKTRKASQKCSVRIYDKNLSNTKYEPFYGASSAVLEIMWPDNDKSIYLFSDSGEMVNLRTHRTYHYKDWMNSNYFGDSITIIDDNNRTHVRLWQ